MFGSAPIQSSLPTEGYSIRKALKYKHSYQGELMGSNRATTLGPDSLLVHRWPSDHAAASVPEVQTPESGPSPLVSATAPPLPHRGLQPHLCTQQALNTTC